MREVEKLTKIRSENEKILSQLRDISRGKQLTIGSLKNSPRNVKPVSLDKRRRDADRIDKDNAKILDAILNAKPIIPVTSAKHKRFA